ncbi:MAG: DUF2231 domain-containing protein [Planctomycetota bacterium]
MVLFWVLFLTALSSAEAAGPAPPALPNPMCPVLTDQKANPAFFVDYQGRRIYFCCGKCRGDFLRNPSAYLANLRPLQTAATVPGSSPASVPPVGAPSSEATQEDSEHHHEHEHGNEGWLERLGVFHPAAVHFPIALLLVAALAEIIAFFSSASFFRSAARFNVLIGAAGAIVAMFLGFLAEDEYHGIGILAGVPLLTIHKSLGISATVLAVFTAILSEWSQRRESLSLMRFYRAFLFVAAVAVAVTGFFGGTLVYGL